MKRTLLSLLAASSLAVALPAVANAQTWASINERQANLDQRIDNGVRNGDLTRAEADMLRADFNRLAHLEVDYRSSAPGLTLAETQDLDRRFDALSQRIRVERADTERRGGDYNGGDYNGGDRRNDRAWNNIQDRRAQLDMRIDRALADRRLSWREARDLKRQTAALVRLEAQYRASRPGLTGMERADLDRRADTISTRIRDQARSYGAGYGNGNGYGNSNGYRNDNGYGR
jgi:hypothetical protein